MITCREFVAFLDQYLSNQLPPDRAAIFHDHMAHCPDCRNYLESYRQTVRLEQLALDDDDAPAIAVPAEILQAVLQATRNQ